MPSSSPRRARQFAAACAAGSLAVTLAGVSVSADAAPAASAKPSPEPVAVQLLAFNDFHGQLEANSRNTVGTTVAGGSEYLATHLDRLREGHENSVTVAAGDLIGGSTFLSGLFHDEPTVESLESMGLDVSGVGNHEFDEGVTELQRMQRGGCHPVDGCYFPEEPYDGADFRWLAANVTNDKTGRTPLAPTWVESFKGTKVGFIGMTLEGTDALVAQSGIKGWSFQDEVKTANALVPTLQRKGVEAIVVLLHEGGYQTGGYDACEGISGPVLDIAEGLDPEIDAVVTGHTHQAYNCSVPDPAGEPRSVTSAASHGRIVTELTMDIDRATGEVDRSSVEATNHIVTNDVPASAVQTGIIAKWAELSDAIGSTVVGQVTGDITRAYTGGKEDRGLESSAGNLIADAQLEATKANGAQIAFMNPGGIRADLAYASSAKGEGDGAVTYAEAYAVQPFGNLLSTIPMTGAQIKTMLEQQCQPKLRQFQLGVSAGFSYTDTRTVNAANNQDCLSIEVSDLTLNDVAIDPNATYLVTVNNFLADGGDNFSVFKEIDASLRVGGGEDLDALIDYLAAHSPVAPPATTRVTEVHTVVTP